MSLEENIRKLLETKNGVNADLEGVDIRDSLDRAKAAERL